MKNDLYKRLNIQEEFDKQITVQSDLSKRKIALAVSGGVDSVAMCILARNCKIDAEFEVLFVNHNTREQIILEQALVKRLAKECGFKFTAFSWREGGVINKGNFQSLARRARYDFMSNYCRGAKIDIIATAHHLDDKIESFLMKKQRKAGELGRSSNIINFYNDIKIIRPLHNIRKFQLKEYLLSIGQEWLEDSSNIDEKYQRNKIRKEIAGYTKQQLTKIINEIQQADNNAKIFSAQLVQAIAQYVEISSQGFARIRVVDYLNLNDFLQIHILSMVLTIISGADKLPRFRNIEKFIQELQHNKIKNYTLANCMIIIKDNSMYIFKELAKIEVKKMLVDQVVWDRRYKVYLKKSARDYYIGALSQACYRVLKKDQNFLQALQTTNIFACKKQIFTIPAIYHLEKVVALPHINYYSDYSLKDNVKIIFYPNYISRFTHFKAQESDE